MTTDLISPVPPINKKVLVTLWVASLVGFLAVLPYSYSLNGQELNAGDLFTTPMLISSVQNILMYGILILVGLYIARRLGLGAPILTGLYQREPVGDLLRGMLVPSLIIGVCGGLLVLLLDILAFGPALANEMKPWGIDAGAITNPPAWQGLLASLYGGINEELLLRLFVLTLIGGLIALATRKMDRKLPVGIFWIANLLAAILFGLGHLPATAGIGLPLDFLTISRAILLNGIVGIGCGWLYWKHGLESAMLGHFSADIVLHVLFPLAMSLLTV